MVFKKRQMVFVPEANPKSFLLFFEKGDTGLSWSFHDYSVKGPFKRQERSDFGWTADQVRGKAQYSFDAPTVGTNEFDFWHERTLEYNKTYLDGTVESASVSPAEIVDRTKRRSAKEIIDHFLDLSSDIYTKEELARRASWYKRKIDGAGVSAASVSRVYGGHRVGRLIRESVASVINPLVPCTADDLLPPDSRATLNPVKANESL